MENVEKMVKMNEDVKSSTGKLYGTVTELIFDVLKTSGFSIADIALIDDDDDTTKIMKVALKAYFDVLKDGLAVANASEARMAEMAVMIGYQTEKLKELEERIDRLCKLNGSQIECQAKENDRLSTKFDEIKKELEELKKKKKGE